MIFEYVLVAILGAAAMAFAVQNPDPVTVSLVNSRTVALPLSPLLMLAVFMGIVFASVSGFAREIELKLKIKPRNLSMRVRQSVAECRVGVRSRSFGGRRWVDPDLRGACRRQ
jgi:uncharacterized integral membrane protein